MADRFDLRSNILLDTRLASASWTEADQRWHAVAASGQQWWPHFLVMACGGLSTSNTSALPGLDSFAGRVLHTAHWPHEPVDFNGQRVGVIGTGSSGVQVIPAIARQADRVTVFQRTAAYVVPAHNGPLDPAYEAHIKADYADYAGFRARNRLMRTGFGSNCRRAPRRRWWPAPASWRQNSKSAGRSAALPCWALLPT